MLPAFLITFREVIEATLIVATILGILVKLNQHNGIKTVWTATGAAVLVSVLLLAIGSFVGIKVQEIYTGKTEEFIEGVLMIISAIFITWAVFFLHTYFASYKTQLLQKLKNTVEKQEKKGLFVLVFTAVFREGIEIVLFLSTIYFSTNPQQIFTGFILGIIGGLTVSFLLFTATFRMPIYYAFKTTSILLILFAGGLLARGVHEFAEAGIIPEFDTLTFIFLPQKSTVAADMIKAIFGITQQMDILQIVLYTGYISVMMWWVFFRNRTAAKK